MPNFNSDLAAAAAASSVSDKQVSGLRISPNISYLIAEVLVKSAMVQNDTIQLGDLPAGCIPIPSLSHVIRQNPGTTLTIDVGHAANPDAYADALALGGAAGKAEFAASGTFPVEATTPVPITEKTRVYATISAAVSSLTNDAKMVFYIAYRTIN